jgi:hypothetical protein
MIDTRETAGMHAATPQPVLGLSCRCCGWFMVGWQSSGAALHWGAKPPKAVNLFVPGSKQLSLFLTFRVLRELVFMLFLPCIEDANPTQSQKAGTNPLCHFRGVLL